jgi:predicted dehydrogenase
MGRNYDESLEMYENSLKSKSIFKIGFNHRFHPSLWDVKKFLSYNTIGEIMYIKASYGHGGRPGMENEWRSSKDLCGGGELLDQGVHLIDLTNWFIGEFNSVYASISTKFWNINVEDNAFIYITKNNIDIHLHVSWTNWKNSFNYEIYGTKGYLKVNGLGGSYGKETLEIGERKPEGGIPNITKIEYDKDNSWLIEWQNLKNNIKNNIDLIGNHIDGLYANKIINHLYESSIKKEIIKL